MKSDPRADADDRYYDDRDRRYEAKGLPSPTSVSGKPLLALRWQVIVGALVCWNALFLAAIAANNWQPRFTNPLALGLEATACFGAAAFALTVVLSSRLRSRVVHPQRCHLYRPGPYVFISLVTALVGCGALISALH